MRRGPRGTPRRAGLVRVRVRVGLGGSVRLHLAYSNPNPNLNPKPNGERTDARLRDGLGQPRLRAEQVLGRDRVRVRVRGLGLEG